jgi:hypothetical protein
MWWRRRGGKSWAACRGEPNRLAFRDLVLSSAAKGVIAFSGDEPIGWCNYGPREDFQRLVTSRVLQRPTGPACRACSKPLASRLSTLKDRDA